MATLKLGECWEVRRRVSNRAKSEIFNCCAVQELPSGENVSAAKYSIAAYPEPESKDFT